MMTLWGSVWAEVPGPFRLTKYGFLQKAMTFQFHASPCSFSSNTHQTTTPCFHELHYVHSTHWRQTHIHTLMNTYVPTIFFVPTILRDRILPLFMCPLPQFFFTSQIRYISVDVYLDLST